MVPIASVPIGGKPRRDLGLQLGREFDNFLALTVTQRFVVLEGNSRVNEMSVGSCDQIGEQDACGAHIIVSTRTVGIAGVLCRSG